MEEGYIKLHRSMLDWEWYDDPNTFKVFIHCLLKANWEASKWHGLALDAGQFVTSLPKLAEETHLSVHQVRTALKHLSDTGEVADKGHSKYRVITINKWVDYQTERQTSGRQKADKGQTSGRQVASDKEIKEGKKLKEEKNIYGEYRHVKLTQAEFDRLVNDYGESETLAAIKFLDEYIQEKPSYKSSDHNLAMRRWVFSAVKENRERNRGTSNNPQNVFKDWADA